MIILKKYLDANALTSLGCELHNERITKGISLSEASKQTGIASEEIDKLEIGKVSELNLETLFKLLDYYKAKLNISINEI